MGQFGSVKLYSILEIPKCINSYKPSTKQGKISMLVHKIKFKDIQTLISMPSQEGNCSLPSQANTINQSPGPSLIIPMQRVSFLLILGTTLCNIFYITDCVKVTSGSFTVYLNNGEIKVFIPK